LLERSFHSSFGGAGNFFLYSCKEEVTKKESTWRVPQV
jgi:hypothetical protein